MNNQSKCPLFLQEHTYTRSFKLNNEKKNIVWENLQKRETFVKGQIFPYKVEFDSDSQEGCFKENELNIHHGPLLSVHGSIGGISDTYRSLNYFYGSYIISFRFIRPVKLEFLKTEDGIDLKIKSYVHPKILPLWNLGNNIFWRFFGISFLF